MSDGEMEDQKRKEREYMNKVICKNKDTEDNSTKNCNTIINKNLLTLLWDGVPISPKKFNAIAN